MLGPSFSGKSQEEVHIRTSCLSRKTHVTLRELCWFNESIILREGDWTNQKQLTFVVIASLSLKLQIRNYINYYKGKPLLLTLKKNYSPYIPVYWISRLFQSGNLKKISWFINYLEVSLCRTKQHVKHFIYLMTQAPT